MQVNFTGRLLGPGGQNLKAMQEQTGCKMSIMGRGSMRDKAKVGEMLFRMLVLTFDLLGRDVNVDGDG